MGKMRYRGLAVNHDGNGYFEDPSPDGKIILKQILRWDGRIWTRFIWLRKGISVGCCTRGKTLLVP
jgi:hypothetical protein